MFTRIINSTKFTGGYAEKMFSNIRGDYFSGDRSFVSTLRALLAKRICADEKICLVYDACSFTTERIKSGIFSAIFSDDYWMERGRLSVISFVGSEDENIVCFEALDREAAKALPGYYLNEILTKFLDQRKIRARFYVNDDLCSAHIFIERLDVKKWHCLQSFIPRYFPKYFSETPLSEDEMTLLKSLTNRYSPDYEKQIEFLSNQYDFRSAMVRNLLSDFEASFEKADLKDTKKEIEYCENEIKSLERRFAEFYSKIQDLRIREIGLTKKISCGSSEDSEFMEYVLANKSIDILRADNGCIEFIVKTVTASYDPDQFTTVINRTECNPFFGDYFDRYGRYDNEFFTTERIKKLMCAIYEDELLKLCVCSAYRINFRVGSFAAIRDFEFTKDVLSEYTPNQHIQHYACLGSNEPEIRAAMLNRNYIGAIAACTGAAININFYEDNTISLFMREILRNDVGRIILMPDGTKMTPEDAVKWLEERENKEAVE